MNNLPKKRNNKLAMPDRHSKQKGGKMREFTHEIVVENGLHARPAGALASIAKRFKSEIQIKTDKKEADSKRLLSIMTLGATKGTVLKFIINGEDENEAEKAIRDFCAEHLS